MNESIERISAQRDLRGIAVAMAVLSGEGLREAQDSLKAEMGVVVKNKPYRDKQGIEELKRMLL